MDFGNKHRARRKRLSSERGFCALRLLFTNDDGINADGLWALMEQVSKNFTDVEVLTVAPDKERSATGHAISVHTPIEVREIAFADPRFKIFSAGGTPADCVKLALEGIVEAKPDFLISGINRGSNLGPDVFYSGTVSAALEGALAGVRSMAVSLTAYDNLDYTEAAEFVIALVKKAHTDPKWPNLVNVNIPNVPRQKLAGVMATHLGGRANENVFQKRQDPKGRWWYWMGGGPNRGETPEGSDIWAIKRNFVSLTPLLTDLTDEALIPVLKDTSWPF